MKNQWYKNSVIYQIYPQSFCDFNGDGIGDIKGIISKLDYLSYLGIDGIWICPIYDSPNHDNGYDVRDYKKLQTQYGSMRDFDNLVAQAHQRDIKIIMDLVVNHSSNEHQWFVESRSSKTNIKRDWYIWKDGKDGKAPTNWGAIFGGSAWTYDKTTNQYYLGTFSPYQPDINWENKGVREEIFNMVNWWIDKGVDGFRMDAINFISKDLSFADGKIDGNEYADIYPFVANGAKVHEYLQELQQRVFARNATMTVGEASSATVNDAINFAREMDMIFQFEHIALDVEKGQRWGVKNIDIVELKQVLSKWQTSLHGKAWNALFWENHDQPRIVSRLGDSGIFRETSAKMLATNMFLMQGTPFIFQGQELGVCNTEFASIEEVKDFDIVNAYKKCIDEGSCFPQKMMNYINLKGRDTSRTPMLWDATANGGFSTGKPWIKVNDKYKGINVAEQMEREDSCLNYFKRLLAFRKNNSTIQDGEFELIDEANDCVFAYIRKTKKERLLVVCNFTDVVTKYCPTSVDMSTAKQLLSNIKRTVFLSEGILQPYESIVIKLA